MILRITKRELTLVFGMHEHTDPVELSARRISILFSCTVTAKVSLLEIVRDQRKCVELLAQATVLCDLLHCGAIGQTVFT